MTRRTDGLVLVDAATGAELPRLKTWLAVMVMLSGTMFVSLVVTAVSPIMQTLAEHFGRGGHGELVAYGIAILPSVGIMVGGPATGWVVERVGARSFVLATLLVFGLAGSAGLYLDNVWLLVATRFLVGVSASGVVTGTLIMIGAYFDPVMRARMLGYQAAVGAVSALLVILFSGVLADWAGWRAPFALYLLGFVIFAAAAIAIPRRPAGPRAARTAAEGSAWAALATVWAPLAVMVGLFIGSFMPTLQVSFLLASNGVLVPSNQSLVLATSALMVGAGSAVFGPVRRRIDDRTMLGVCALFIGAGIVVMGLSHEGVQVAIGCGISGIGTGLLNPQVNNMLIARAGAAARGRAVGLGYTARYSGDFINPVIVRPLALHVGLHGAFLILGAAFLAGAALDAMLRRFAPAPA